MKKCFPEPRIEVVYLVVSNIICESPCMGPDCECQGGDCDMDDCPMEGVCVADSSCEDCSVDCFFAEGACITHSV